VLLMLMGLTKTDDDEDVEGQLSHDTEEPKEKSKPDGS
jgi:hypothetical protein